MESQTLKAKTIHALFWSFLERIGQQGIHFVISIILARLLLPEEFGLIAMLTIFIAIAELFVDGGFGHALIQKKKLTHLDECSIFYGNIFLSVVFAGLLCLVAPWIVSFYNQPLLLPLTYALSLNLIINSFGLVQRALLSKKLNFKTLLKATFIATTFSGVVGVVMAFKGFGVWSLVAQSICGNFLRTVCLWFLSAWRPSFVFSFASLREMFSFSSRMLASGLLNTIFENLYFVVIGKLFSPVSLGYYSRAQRLQKLPAGTISDVVNRVSLPVFSYVQDDAHDLKRAVRKALAFLAMINFPLMIGLSFVAEPLVLVLLTEKWLPCVKYFQLLCWVGLLHPLHTVNLNVLVANGRSDVFFRLEVLKKVLVVISILSTYRWGISIMIYGQIATSFLAFFFNTYYTGKLVGYPFLEQAKDVLPFLCVSFLVGLVTHSLSVAVFSSSYSLLLSQLFVGVASYVMVCYIFKLPPFMEVVAMIQNKVRDGVSVTG